MKLFDHITQITETAKGATDHVMVGAGAAGLFLSNINTVLSIIALVMSIAWYGYRFYSAWQDKKRGKTPNLQ